MNSKLLKPKPSLRAKLGALRVVWKRVPSRNAKKVMLVIPRGLSISVLRAFRKILSLRVLP